MVQSEMKVGHVTSIHAIQAANVISRVIYSYACFTQPFPSLGYTNSSIPTMDCPRCISWYTSPGLRTTHSDRPSTNTPRRRSSLMGTQCGLLHWVLEWGGRHDPTHPFTPYDEVGPLGFEHVADDFVVDLEVRGSRGTQNTDGRG